MSTATVAVVRSATGLLTAIVAGAVFGLACYTVGPGRTLLVLAGAGFLVLAARLPAVALTITPLLASFENHQLSIVGIGGLSPIEASMLALAAGWAWRALTGQTVVYPTVRDWPILLLIVALLPGVALGSSTVVIARLFIMWLAFFVAYLLVQGLEPQQMRRVLIAYAVGAAALGVEGVVNYINGGGAHLLQGGADVYGRASGAIADPNYFAAFLQLSAIPALALLVGGRGRWRYLLVVPLGLATAGVVLSLSRGGILGMSAAAVIVILGWTRSRIIALFLLTVLIAATVSGLNPFVNARVSEVVGERLSSVTTQSSDNHRFLLWHAAVNIVEENPLFGIGANAFQAEANRRGLTERGIPLENVHNTYLNIATELGLLGALGFGAWLIRIARDLLRAFRRKVADSHALVVGLAAAFVGYCIQALTVSQYRVEIIQATFFVFAGMVAALARRSGDEQPQS